MLNAETPADTAAVTETPPGRPQFDRAVLYDKVLGCCWVRAIGDAMGAPTEMWSRRDIMVGYGVVNRLDTMVRAPSAEGTWAYNLPAGGTTDDTRWKKLTAEFLLKQRSGFGATGDWRLLTLPGMLLKLTEDTWRSSALYPDTT